MLDEQPVAHAEWREEAGAAAAVAAAGPAAAPGQVRRLLRRLLRGSGEAGRLRPRPPLLIQAASCKPALEYLCPTGALMGITVVEDGARSALAISGEGAACSLAGAGALADSCDHDPYAAIFADLVSTPR